VGGDFYHFLPQNDEFLPQNDESIVIVLGDVSGKGLKAAMTGAIAIEALRFGRSKMQECVYASV
jgi:serine phosphatase RsbU (regulator of sigma subunit)